MESSGRNRILIGTGLVFFLFLILTGQGLCASLKSRTLILRSGDPFPPISFPEAVKTGERKYLGVQEKPLFSVAEIEAEVLVVKFLNSNCVYCIKSLPVFDEIFQLLEEDPGLKSKIKMLGFSAGDASGEVAAYTEKYRVPYPIFPDPEFKAHRAVHEPTVPFIVIAKKDREGKWVVASTHVGLTFSAESFVGELRAVLEIDPNALKKN